MSDPTITRLRESVADYERLAADADMVELIAAAVPAAVVDGATGTVLYTTEGFDRLFGYIKGELTGKSIELLIPQRFHQKHRHHREHFSLYPSERPMGERTMELWGRRRDDSEFVVAIGLHPEYRHGRLFVVATALHAQAITDGQPRKHD